MNKKSCYLLGAILALSSPMVMAEGDKETELKAQANSAGASLKKLEKQIKRNKKKFKKLSDSLAAEKERVQFNGFITVGATVADDDLGTGYHFSDRPNFISDSKVGLQTVYKLSDNMDATVQLVARSRSSDSWNVDAEWAYLSYEVTDWAKVRVGKLRIPFYLFSESIDVGFAYPWARPPVDMYTTLITAFDGMDVTFKVNTGPLSHNIQLWAAATTNTDSDAATDIDFYDTYGLNITSSWNDFTVRLGATQLKLEGTSTVELSSSDFGSPAGIPNDPTTGIDFLSAAATCTNNYQADDLLALVGAGPGPAGLACLNFDLTAPFVENLGYYTAALQYDDGSLFAILEASALDAKFGAFIGDGRVHVATVGYRIGNWTPYLMSGQTQSKPSAQESTGTERRSGSLGLRYGLNDSTAITAEWNRFYNMEGDGGFSSEALAASGKTDLPDSNVYSITIDAVF